MSVVKLECIAPSIHGFRLFIGLMSEAGSVSGSAAIHNYGKGKCISPSNLISKKWLLIDEHNGPGMPFEHPTLVPT